ADGAATLLEHADAAAQEADDREPDPDQLTARRRAFYVSSGGAPSLLMSSSRSWRVSGSDIRRCCISSAERRISGSDSRRSDIAWKRVAMSFIEASCATWSRIGWLAAATTASAWTRIISMPLQP